MRTGNNNDSIIINNNNNNNNNNILILCESFEPRSHFKSRLSLIVRVNIVLNGTVVVDND